jgi:hypothetical protein
LMIRIKLMMLIGIMAIMGTAQVILLLRSTQHGSTPLPRTRQTSCPCPILLCMVKNHNLLEVLHVVLALCFRLSKLGYFFISYRTLILLIVLG